MRYEIAARMSVKSVFDRFSSMLSAPEMVMHLIRLPEHQRDPQKLERARSDFEERLKIVDDQLGRTRYICGESFTYGDIPLGIRVHRWHVLGLANTAFPDIDRWYTEIRARPAFQVWTADPANHLEG
jgi:glutathione S-transferase